MTNPVHPDVHSDVHPEDRVVEALAGIFDISVALLSGAEEEDVLQLLAERSRVVIGAGTTALVLPSVGDDLAIEFAAGRLANSLIGTLISPETTLGDAIRSSRSRAVRQVALLHPGFSPDDFGPAAFAPLVTPGSDATGALLALSDADAPPFTAGQVEITRAFASQAALAFSLAEARTAREDTQLLQERQRIARDLHDLAIQQLFAVGLQLEKMQARAKDIGGELGEFAKELGRSLHGVDVAVGQIRSVVQSLRSSDTREATLSEQVRHETSLSTGGLGFTPSLHLTADALDAIDDQDLAGDVVAVVREGLANAARHARATAVAVSVTVESDHDGDRYVHVAVSDNGRGIDPATTRSSGLSNIRARARRHNGWAEFYPLDPGTMISWRGSIGYLRS